jgi:hypothetical protein
VPDYTKPRLSLSGIILRMNPGVVTAPKDALSSLIPVVPTTLREFDRRGTLTAFARIYQGAGRPPSAVTATVRVVDSAGRSMFESIEEIGPSRLVPGPPSSFDWKVAVPIDRLREGRYLLIVEAKAGADAVRRDVRFTARWRGAGHCGGTRRAHVDAGSWRRFQDACSRRQARPSIAEK